MDQTFDDEFEELSGLRADDSDDEPVQAMPGVVAKTRGQATAKPAPDVSEEQTLVDRLRPTSRRAGEQEALKSPLVLGLVGGGLVLLLVSAAFFVSLGQNTVRGLYGEAESEVEEGRYKQAIDHLDQFIKLYPSHEEYTPKATFLMYRAKIEAQISGSVPDWKQGLVAVDEYKQETRDLEGFDDSKQEYLFSKVVEIAVRAGEEAGKSLRDTKRGRELLQTSREALSKLSLYKLEEKSFGEAQARIDGVQKDADRKLYKQEIFDSGLGEIRGFMEKKQPMEALVKWRGLLRRYKDLENDPQLKAELNRVLEVEQKLISRDETSRDASVKDEVLARSGALTLALNTRVRSGEASEGRNVFVVGRDCVFGVDTITGRPIWRRVVGLDLPFFPNAVSSAVPCLLLVDVNRRELILLKRKDGSLVWRLPLRKQERVEGPPLIANGQVYLVTRTDRRGHLIQVSLATGQQTARLTFSQPLEAPPVLLAGGQRMVICGEREVLYSLTLRPLRCQAVTHLGHPAGSISAPLLAMGQLLLLPENGSAKSATAKPKASKKSGENLVVAENDRMDSCQLRVLAVTDEGRKLTSVASVRLEGHVRDTPILRGRDLFVPFTGERIAAFTVSDDPNHKPLTNVASHQNKTPHAGPIHLSVGPGGHLWMAASKLQRFQLTSNSLKLNPNPVGRGLSSQPLQSIGNQLFLGRRTLFSDSVIFTRVERDAQPEMISHWRTVVGAGLLDFLPLNNGLLLCVSETGGLFHVRDTELQSGGFKTEMVGEMRLPDGVTEPLQAVRLSDGQLAVWCGAPSPKLWIINTVGTVEQEIDLGKDSLQAPPVQLAGGIVVPLPGRLKLIARAGVPKDFPAAVSEGVTRKWKWAAATGKDQLLVVDSEGELIQLQFRATPSPHLFRVNSQPLKSPLDLPPRVYQDRVTLVSADGRLLVLGRTDLQVQLETQLKVAASGGPWLFGTRVLVETGGTTLMCLNLSDNLKPLWSVDLKGQSLAGAPLEANGRLVVAQHQGTVFTIETASGKTGPSQNLGQPIQLGPRRFGKKVLVTSIDGTLYRVESLLAEE